MKRIFSVELRVRAQGPRDGIRLTPIYECVADTAVEAIRRAIAQARRDNPYRGAYVVEQLIHRGPAI